MSFVKSSSSSSPLEDNEVIKLFTSIKNNIEVVNVSSTDFDQMLLCGNGTKDSSIEFNNNNNVDYSDYFTTSTFSNVVRTQVGIFLS